LATILERQELNGTLYKSKKLQKPDSQVYVTFLFTTLQNPTTPSQLDMGSHEHRNIIMREGLSLKPNK
jgi:hypothetical protein